MTLRVGFRAVRALQNVCARPAARPVASTRRCIHASSASNGTSPLPGSKILLNEPNTASASPFTEPTSPNPTISKYAETTEALHTYGSYITQCLSKFVQQFSVLKDELTLYTAPSGIIPVLTFLRDHSQCQFKACMDISGVDFPEREKRFEVVYSLLSVKLGGRIRVKTYAGEADPVPSAVEVYKGADWLALKLLVEIDVEGNL